MRRETGDRRNVGLCAWRRNRGCHRCRWRRRAESQRWHAHRRLPTCAAAYAPIGLRRSSIGLQIVYVEVIELPRRTVTAEFAGIDFAIDPGFGEYLAELLSMFVRHRLLDAVGA